MRKSCIILTIWVLNTQIKLEWRKHAFECKLEHTYEIEIQNGMTRIYDNELNNTAECNLLHDIINLPKLTNNLNNHYSPILDECMNTRKGKTGFKNFLILFDSGCSSTILMRSIVEKLHPKKYYVMTCSRPRRPVRSHSLVCNENPFSIIGIGPIPVKEL